MSQQGDSTFPNTHWTLIARAKSGDDDDARRALNELCGQYQFPLYCFIRRSGLDHQDAEDALQDFFAKVFRLEAFEGAAEARGGLLVTSLRRFLVKLVARPALPAARGEQRRAVIGLRRRAALPARGARGNGNARTRLRSKVAA